MSYGIIIRLETALERIAELSDVIAGKSRADLRQDRLFQLGLEQYLVRLGRTLAAVLTREPALAGTITCAPAVVERVRPSFATTPRWITTQSGI